MPGLLASTISTSGHLSPHIAVRLTGREVVVGLLFIGLVVVLLATPVVWGAVAEAAGTAAEKAAPGTFFLGLGLLFTGLVAGVRLLDIAGGSLVGLVVIGVIVDNYLVAVCRAASSGRPGAGYGRRVRTRINIYQHGRLRRRRPGLVSTSYSLMHC